jgi:dTDP-4-dehydrorhamnose 3,5-epimerase
MTMPKQHPSLPSLTSLTELPDVALLRLRMHRDERGAFVERWRRSVYSELGLPEFVQDNHAISRRGVLRGLHYQAPPHAQGKLVWVLRGAIYDVVVDVRRSSPGYGRWAGVRLEARRAEQLWVPPGFAHGYLTLSQRADVLYKVTAEHAPEAEGGVRWDDPDLAIDWPLDLLGTPRLSGKDTRLPLLRELDTPFQ